MPDELVHALVLLLSGVLAAAGLTKLVAPARFAMRVEALVPGRFARAEAHPPAATSAVEGRSPGRFPALAAVGLALGELGLAVLLLVGLAPRAAALLSLAALGALTVALLVLARRAPEAGCGCFGDDEPAPVARGVLRNGALAVAAAAVALDPPGAEVWAAGSGPMLGAVTVALGAACLWSLAWVLAAP